MKINLKFLAVFVTGAYLLNLCACAGVQAPKPKVMLSPLQYPNSKSFSGVSIAVIPFDPRRDIYADPNEPNPRRPDFNWFKAGVCPTRFIIANDSQKPVVIDPTQVTCADLKGTTYKAYDAREAGDAVVSSEAFNSYVKGAIAGAVIAGILGAGLGAAIGGIAGGRSWAGRGAALGATYAGTQGLVLGAVANRAAMEQQARLLLISNQLMPKTLAPGMTHDGLVYLPAVQIQSIRLLIASSGYQETTKAEIPVIMPPQELPGISEKEGGGDKPLEGPQLNMQP